MPISSYDIERHLERRDYMFRREMEERDDRLRREIAYAMRVAPASWAVPMPAEAAVKAEAAKLVASPIAPNRSALVLL